MNTHNTVMGLSFKMQKKKKPSGKLYFIKIKIPQITDFFLKNTTSEGLIKTLILYVFHQQPVYICTKLVQE